MVPGLGWYERSLVLALAVFVLTTAAVVLWVQWGADWVPASAVVVSSLGAAVWGNVPAAAGAAMRALPAAHEFPLVVVVVSGIVWCRSAVGRLPLIGRLAPGATRYIHVTEYNDDATIARYALLITRRSASASATAARGRSPSR